jgi:5'-nucleotidase/UDP-sugar diphosphatase
VPKYDAVTDIELGNLEAGYRHIDLSGKDDSLYSLTCPLMLVPLLMALPRLTKGKLAVVPKNKAGQPLKSRVEALVDIPRRSSAQLMAPKGTVDRSSIPTGAGHETGSGAVEEIKEWQAIMDHLRSLPVKNPGDLPEIPVDERAAEVRAITVQVG